MRVLIACECSGRVRDAFIKAGHSAVSCDLKPTEQPGPHIHDDVHLHLEDGWDMMIAFPDCTYLCSSGLHWNTRRPGREAKTHEAMIFVLTLMNAPIEKIALENPVGCISSKFRKPDQIIQPYEFGEDASKKTCLWLQGLPKLTATEFVEPKYACKCGMRFEMGLGKYGCPNCCCEHGPAKAVYGNQTPSGQNALGPSKSRQADRARTYQGIADAMAAQWNPRKTYPATKYWPIDTTRKEQSVFSTESSLSKQSEPSGD